MADSAQTQQELNATQRGQEAFQVAATNLHGILSTVLGANDQLISYGMRSTAGHQFYKAVNTWVDNAYDVRDLTQWMADTLELTWRQMQANEANGVDLATGIMNQPLPGFDQYGPPPPQLH